MSGVSFSLKASSSKKKTPKTTATTVELGFEQARRQPDESSNNNVVNHDLPKEPLVIPVQEDGRKSLQEQARIRREKTQLEQETATISKEDQAAIEALNAEAFGGDANNNTDAPGDNKMVIESNQDTFQRGGKAKQIDEEDAQFQKDLETLAPEVSVDSDVYQQVRIADFGAALLRGMGWTGKVDTSDTASSLPRPSRLGLGATPKLELNAPTHGRRPRRQDQVQRDKQLKQQQQEYEQQRLENIKRDKQRTMQVGSVVQVNGERQRAIIRKWQGVPGLNMILIQYEGDSEPSKVKRGCVQLVDRSELEHKPFQEPKYKEGKNEYLGEKQQREEEEERRNSRERRRRREEDDRKRRRDKDDDYDDDRRRRRRSEKDSDDERKRRRSDDGDRQERSSDYRKDEDRRRRREKEDRRDRREDDRDRKRHRTEPSSSDTSTWLIPNIRVRVVTHKMGKAYYKEKGVVVDVLKGRATLKMNHTGQVLQVPERYLESALPKVGGNACILTGEHRLAKGRLLQRDSKSNKGSVQVFEDMNIVTTSLDDMAEWCGPLDDDLME